MFPSVLWSTSTSNPCDRVWFPFVHFGDRPNPSCRYSDAVEFGQKLVTRVRFEGTFDQFDYLEMIFDAFGVCCHTRGVRVEVESFAESSPQAFAADRDLHCAIAGTKESVRCDGGMVVALRRAYLAGDGPLRSLKRVNTDHAGQERRSDNAASPRLLAFLQSRDDTERPVHSGEKIGDRNSDSLNVRPDSSRSAT